MGGGGSGYSGKDIKALKDAFKDEIEESSTISNANSSDEEGIGADGGGGELSQFPINCQDGTIIDADALSGELSFSKQDVEAIISFEVYEEEYVEEYAYNYCAAAPDILEEYGD